MQIIALVHDQHGDDEANTAYQEKRRLPIPHFCDGKHEDRRERITQIAAQGVD